MSRHGRSLSSDYFTAIYEADPDPWRFATSCYEQKKYAATLAALRRPRYPAAFEIGCSIGILTQALAGRCDELLAVDVAEAALAEARRRCQRLPGVRFANMRVPADWPGGTFDLILLSEVVYYLDLADVGHLVERVTASARPGAEVVLVHWIGATDYPLGGDEAAQAFIDRVRDVTRLRHQSRTDRYRMDILEFMGGGGAAFTAAG